jgi:beta-phosphoglucomutase-like phosphatase (HAD superfamily)
LSLPLIRAVVFDCDGVLVDSEPMHAAATRDEMRARGCELADDFFDDYIGMRVVDQIAVLADRFGIDPLSLFEARERRFWSLAVDQFREVPGSAETVRALHAAGLKIAVATSGTRKWIDHVIHELGLSTEISASISAADVQEPKPHPQAYLAAAEAIGLPAHRCGVVEDSELGCRSAVSAGCLVVILDRDRRAADRFAGAATITASMSQAREFLLRASGQNSDPAPSPLRGAAD